MDLSSGAAAGLNRAGLQLCPICGGEFAIADMDEHLRIELLDPKWREQRQAQVCVVMGVGGSWVSERAETQQTKRGIGTGTGEGIETGVRYRDRWTGTGTEMQSKS